MAVLERVEDTLVRISTPDEALQTLVDLINGSRVPEARSLAPGFVARWPEHVSLRRFATVIEPPRAAVSPAVPTRSYARELAWIKAHAREYPGCWMAVLNDQLLAVDPDPEVRAARAAESGHRRCYSNVRRTDRCTCGHLWDALNT